MLIRRVVDSVVEELSKVRVWIFHDHGKMRGKEGSFFKWETREAETNDSKAVEFEETFDLRGFEPKEGMKILFEFVHVKVWNGTLISNQSRGFDTHSQCEEHHVLLWFRVWHH
jgi:hypothetical protein